MKRIYTIVLFSTLSFLLYIPAFAQIDYSNDQIIGKWNLTSASFNGQEIMLSGIEEISFEFTNGGEVTLVRSNGMIEKGEYLIEAGYLIDPNTPEHLNANILGLTNDELILSMNEDLNEVVLIFELEGFASR